MDNEELQMPESMETDYVQAINDLKANSVSREEYAKLKAENKKLLNSLVQGETIEASKSQPKETTADLRKKLFNQKANLSNLEYVDTALKLRAAVIEEGGIDPFVPQGKNIVATDEDIATANRVATTLQSLVDYAAGDSNIFTNELQRMTVDTYPGYRR